MHALIVTIGGIPEKVHVGESNPAVIKAIVPYMTEDNVEYLAADAEQTLLVHGYYEYTCSNRNVVFQLAEAERV